MVLPPFKEALVAVEVTPLGFKKPDGNERVRDGDNVISDNAQKSQDLHASANSRFGVIESAAAALTTRVSTAEGTVASQGTRLTAAEVSITSQGSRLTTAEGTIATQGTRLTATEAVANQAIPAWKSGETVAVGARRISPNGDVVSANVAHTTTATYAPSNWTLSVAATTLANALGKKGVIADGTDINTLRTPGYYTVASSASAATMLNLPVGVPCEIVVKKNDAATLTTQKLVGIPLSNGNFELWTRTTRSASTWDTSWKSDRQGQGVLPDGTNLDTLRVPGSYIIATATSAATMTGMPTIDGVPVNNTAVIHVLTASNSSAGEQRISIYVADGVYKKFSRVTRSASSWPAWQNDSPSATVTPVTPTILARAGARHDMLKQQAYARRGPVGIKGKRAAVSIRMDHWLNDTFAKALPMLEDKNLPASICLNVDNMGDPQNNLITWPMVIDMALHRGVEIWNHGADHIDHTDEAGIIDAIVGGQQRLQAAVGPKLVVDGWMSNGSSYYDGFTFGRTFEAWTDTVAADSIMYAHAFADGKNTGFLQPLDGRIKLGGSHYSAESGGAAPTIARIEEAKKLGRGITIYFHPGLIDQPGGFTLADLEVLFTWLAEQRDAGLIEILTPSAMAMADMTHDRRENLLTNTQFADGWTGWTKSPTGYTTRTVGEGEDAKTLLVASDTATTFYQNITTSNNGWAMGGMFELIVPARAATNVPATLRLKVHDVNDDTRLKKEKLFTLPADGDLTAEVPVPNSTKNPRIFVTIPADFDSEGKPITTNIRATLERESGGSIEYMEEPYLRPC